jgi:protein SCO1/2
MTPARKRAIIGLCVACGTLLILGLYLPALRQRLLPPQETSRTSGTPLIGGAFRLIDAKGRPVTEALLQGHYSLLYFGFTHCPDVCPLALATITDALKIAGPAAETVLPVFITIDPERDTPQIVGDYVANFHPRFVALTGTAEDIRAVTAAYRVYFAKAAGGTPDDYTMGHSDFIYLMGPDGRYVTHFRAEDTALDIANRLRREAMPR